MPQFADQKLPADYIEQAGDGHQRDAQDHPPEIHVGCAKKHHDQCEHNVDHEPQDEYRQRNCEAGHHSCLDFARNIASVIGLPKTEGKHGGRFFKKYGMRKFCDTRLRAIKHERLVVTALLLPFCNGVGRNALDAQLHPRHIVRRIHDEE